MATTKETEPKKLKAPAPFMKKSELARSLDIDPKTLDRKIAEGIIPPPHTRLGPHTARWLRRHYEYFEAHKRWPAEAFARQS